MARKRCPVCGKSIAAQAQFCIYCSARFDQLPKEQTETAHKVPSSRGSGGKLGLVVTLVSLALILLVLLLVFLMPGTSQSPSEVPADPLPETTVTTVTTTTRNAELDAERQTYIGYWYDEGSIGKRDPKTQGGYILNITEIFEDFVSFELMSYQSHTGVAACATVREAVLNEDTLHFTFEDDMLGHSGEGYLRLAEECVQMEVLLDEKAETEEHSLAVNAVFKRRAVPVSDGYDLQKLTTLNEVKAIAGPQIVDVKKDEKGNSIYTFDSLKAVTKEDGTLVSLTVEYTADKPKNAFCYVCVDGSMTYDVIKTYFGEALHDYAEQPTNIRVLHYALSETSSVTFTFDANSKLLTIVHYVL